MFNRILARLQELSATSEENPDSGDIELIQHIDLDIMRLIKLLTGMNLNVFFLSFQIFLINSTFSFNFSFRNQSKISIGEKICTLGIVNVTGESNMELGGISPT